MVVSPKPSFIEWANKHDEDFSDLVDNEPSVYLIEEDFYDDEAVLKANFKGVFRNELLAVTEDESQFPSITMEEFEKFFSVQMGSTVFDTEKTDLIAD